MGGEGKRFNSTLPKQFHAIAGQPIFLYAVKKCLQAGLFQQIILVVANEWIEYTHSCLSTLPTQTSIQIVAGGTTRQASSYQGILACHCHIDYVMIHDAVRPFIDLDILYDNIEQVQIHNAVDTCIPSADTIVHSLKGEWIENIPPRHTFLRGQTPQSFSRSLILQAHQTALSQGITDSSDDCFLVRRLGHLVRIVPGNDHNIKITTDLDLFLAERILQHTIATKHPKILTTSTKLQGKKIAVTGATGGIGRIICQRLVELGAFPIEISKSSSHYPADLTQHDEVQEVFARIYQEHGAIDGLINSIGSFTVKNLFLLSQQEIEKMIATNLTSVIYCCRYSQIQPKGHIINIASSAYSRGRKEYPIYSAAKAAVVNFTQALAEDCPHLFVNAIVPQRTDTPMRRAHFPEEDPNLLLQPHEIAEKIAHLLHSSELSGTILEVRKQRSSN